MIEARAGLSAALLCLAVAVAGLAGCGASKPAMHPEWVLHARIEDRASGAVSSPAPGSYRLVFEWIAGDLYGSPTTGDIGPPQWQDARHFVLDLNRSHEGLLSELEPTELSLRFLRLEPAAARLARLVPLALQRDGIDPVARPQWIDGTTGEQLMLLYFDRPAHLLGVLSRAGYEVRYDVRVVRAGYAWVRRHVLPDGRQLFTESGPPADLVLEFVPLSVEKAVIHSSSTSDPQAGRHKLPAMALRIRRRPSPPEDVLGVYSFPSRTVRVLRGEDQRVHWTCDCEKFQRQRGAREPLWCKHIAKAAARRSIERLTRRVGVPADTAKA